VNDRKNKRPASGSFVGPRMIPDAFARHRDFDTAKKRKHFVKITKKRYNGNIDKMPYCEGIFAGKAGGEVT
jgi:hypothetical protein